MRLKLKPWQMIVLAMLLGIGAGVWVNGQMRTDSGFTSTGESLVAVFDYVGTLFMKLLKMVIVPLVLSSVVVGIARLGNTKGFAKLGLKTVSYYVLTSLIAIFIGLTMVNLFKPGLVDGKPNEEIARQIEEKKADYAATIQEKVGDEGGGMSTVTDIFLRMVPDNIFQVFTANDQMLALIFVSIVTALGLIFIGDKSRRSLLVFFEAINELSMKVISWVMLLAPIGVFALVAKATAATGFGIIQTMGSYFFVVIASLLTHLFVVLPLFLIFLGRIAPWRHFYAMRNALLTAFSTSSSSATLPITMRAVQENANVSNRVSSFVLPLGATVNMDGTALYECVAVMFVAQVLNWDLTLTQQFLIVMLALLTSIGVAGVPSASLVAIVIIVNNVGIQNGEAVIGLLLAVDRPLDMLRTAVNIFSDSCGAVIIAKSEGERVLE